MSKRKTIPDHGALDDVLAPAPAAPPARLAAALATAEKLTPKKKLPGQLPADKPKARPAAPAATRTRQRKSTRLDVAPKQDLFTGPEAAGYLRVSARTLLRVAKEGQLGHVKVGGRVRFLLEDLDRYARGESARAGALMGWDRLRAKRGTKQG